MSKFSTHFLRMGIFCAVFGFMSCNKPQTASESQTPNASETKKTMPAPSSTTTSKPTQKDNSTVSPKKEVTQNPVKTDVAKTDTTKTAQKDFGAIGEEWMSQEQVGNLKLGMKWQQVIDALGKPDKQSEATVWGADGETHQTLFYTKQGLEMDMVGTQEADKTMNSLTVKRTSALKTSKGIGIGSSEAAVRTAYQGMIDPAFSNPNSIVVGTVYGGVFFSIARGKVIHIFIGAGAE